MRKSVLIGLCCVLLTACSEENAQTVSVGPIIAGEITDIQGGRFLVESVTDESSEGSYDKIWFSTQNPETLTTGLIVSVWADAVDESYPAQAEADKIEIKN